jgi:hypothetical protein
MEAAADWLVSRSVRESLTPSVTAYEKQGVKYGFKWWFYPYWGIRTYGKDDARPAFAGSGFRPGLGHREAIDRVLAAVIQK